MAAHSPTVPVAASVMPYQPPSGWDAWLREIAAAINLIVFKLEDIEGRLDASVPPPGLGEEPYRGTENGYDSRRIEADGEAGDVARRTEAETEA